MWGSFLGWQNFADRFGGGFWWAFEVWIFYDDLYFSSEDMFC